MAICMITFRSVMPAQRGERRLKQAGIPGVLTRTSRKMEQQGCGYSLRVPCDLIDTAIRILNQSGIPYRKVYLSDGNGEPREMVL